MTLVSLLATSIAAFVAVLLVPSAHVVGTPSWAAYLLFAIMLGIVNAIVKPILNLLSLPATILTLGLFLLVIDAIVIAIASYLSVGLLGLGITVDTFWGKVAVALIVSIVSSILIG